MLKVFPSDDLVGLKLLKPCGLGFTNFNNFQIRAWVFWHYANILAN